ncbi:MAG: hypothetical protein HYR85_01075, partial [Planctomycetes bacterium]|nr:hypothetical protein [Planctomycetota bacterium]
MLTSRCVPARAAGVVLGIFASASLAVAQPNPGGAGAPPQSNRKSLSDEAIALRDARWRDFLKRNGDGFSVVYETDSMLPHWILAPAVSVGTPPLDANTVRNAAVAFVRANDSFFGTAGLDLVGMPDLVGDVWAMNFQLVEPHSIIPFDRWSSINVRFKDRAGALSAIVFDRIPLVIEPAEISVDFGEAVTTAMAAVPAGVTDVTPGASSLEYVVTEDGTARVAWRFTIHNGDLHAPYEHDFWIGARDTPDVLRDWDDIGSVDVAGSVTGRGHVWDPTSTLENLPLANLLVSIQGGGKAFTDSEGKFRIPNAGSTAVTLSAALAGRWVHVHEYDGYDLSLTTSAMPGTPTSLVFNDSDGPATSTSQVDAYFHANRAHDEIRATTGISSIDTVLNANVNLPQTCNSYYSHQTRSINLYEGGDGCRNAAYDTVVIHEYGHFFDDMTGGIVDWGLSEGLSDMVATFITGQPLVGESFYMDGRPVRNADNQATYPADRCWTEYHCIGEVFSGFAWHTRENLMATLGFDDGATLASRLFFSAIAMNPHDQRDAVLDVFLQDDDDGAVSNGTPHCSEIEAAC